MFSLSHYLTSTEEAKEPIKSVKISLLICVTPEPLKIVIWMCFGKTGYVLIESLE